MAGFEVTTEVHGVPDYGGDRFGLRASEVAQFKFSDIDWRSGEIRICGKNRRPESLPLPREVGNALLVYVKEGRLPLQIREVFTTVADIRVGALTQNARSEPVTI
jgi:integrase